MKTVNIDRKKCLREELRTGHNRWHPDIRRSLRSSGARPGARDAGRERSPDRAAGDGWGPREFGPSGGASAHGTGVHEGREAADLLEIDAARTKIVLKESRQALYLLAD